MTWDLPEIDLSDKLQPLFLGEDFEEFHFSKSPDIKWHVYCTIVGFKVDSSILIQKVIQNLTLEKLLGEVKHEKVNHW